MTDYAAEREPAPGETARELMRLLGCPCRVFPPMEDDDPLIAAWREARERGKREGFTPMLLAVDDMLLESLGGEGEPDARLRARRLAAAPDPEVWFGERLREMCEDRGGDEDGFEDWKAEAMGEASAREEGLSRFNSFWPYGSERTAEVVLAEIPARDPWEAFAWLPMGGWNDCPDAPEMAAAARSWFERFGAVPAAMSRDELEFVVEEPVPAERAAELALEQYAFCPDRVEQCGSEGAVGGLAESLMKSTVWYFWWD